MIRLWTLCLLLSVNAFAETAPAKGAAPPPPPPPEQLKESGDISTTGARQPKLMDGVELEAVETYINPTQNQLGLGIGLYPFDAYFYGLSLNAGYTYHSSRTFAWEVLNAQYFITFQKDLTTELADRYTVDPKTIDALNYIFSSDVQYTFGLRKNGDDGRIYPLFSLFGDGRFGRAQNLSAQPNDFDLAWTKARGIHKR